MSFSEIGQQTGLGEQMVDRLLRHAMTMWIFREPEPGMVAHTRASRMLASVEMTAWMRVGTEDMWPAATKVPTSPPSPSYKQPLTPAPR